MGKTDELTMLTTADTDLHLIPDPLDVTRMKVERNQWIMTTDNRLVRCDKVVALWTPTEEEIEGFEGV